MNAMQLARRSTLRQPVTDLQTPAEPREPERLGSLRLQEPAESERRAQQGSGDTLAYLLLKHSGRFFAVPSFFGPVCLADRRQRSNPWIFSARSVQQLRLDLNGRREEGTLPQHLESMGGLAILSCGEYYYAIESSARDHVFDPAEEANPKVLVEASLPELKRRILGLAEEELPGAVLGTFQDCGLTMLDGQVLGFSLGTQGAAGLPSEDRRDAGVLTGKTRAEVEAAIENRPRPRAVEFTGWLPSFRHFGNCGAHPQFGHVSVPPSGYTFTQTPPPDGPAPPVLRLKRRGG